ncbi:unnamed protein product [Citrullus colocynthis]|uniref:Secreted protein n=1 Tax=Citrullus colocynthis TaxID=252529 RepID=A0ABP0ZCK8_9ROSI
MLMHTHLWCFFFPLIYVQINYDYNFGASFLFSFFSFTSNNGPFNFIFNPARALPRSSCYLPVLIVAPEFPLARMPPSSSYHLL